MCLARTIPAFLPATPIAALAGGFQNDRGCFPRGQSRFFRGESDGQQEACPHEPAECLPEFEARSSARTCRCTRDSRFRPRNLESAPSFPDGTKRRPFSDFPPSRLLLMTTMTRGVRIAVVVQPILYPRLRYPRTNQASIPW